MPKRDDYLTKAELLRSMKELEERMRREIEEVRAEMEEKIARLDRKMEELEQKVDRQFVGMQVGPLSTPEGGTKLAVRGSQYFFLAQSIVLDPKQDSPLAAPRLVDDSAEEKQHEENNERR